MIVVAKSIKGEEYMYNPKSAHQVKGISPAKMAEFLNAENFDLKAGETWHVHEVYSLDNAYGYGSIQMFERKRNGNIVRTGVRV